MKPNQWMMDKAQLLEKFPNFSDQYYLQELCSHLSAYLRRCPVKVLCIDNGKSNKLIFRVKSESESFELDPDIAYHDFIFMVERQWLRQFFPSYEFKDSERVVCTDAEMTSLLENHTVDNLLSKTELGYKEQVTKKFGRITKIALMDDRFKIETNEGSFWRITKLPLSQFLDELRTLEDDREKKQWIDSKSTILNQVKGLTQRSYQLTHTPKQLLNFFRIRKDSMKKYLVTLLPLVDEVYQWGPFLFKFASPQHEAECRQIIGEQSWQKTTQPPLPA